MAISQVNLDLFKDYYNWLLVTRQIRESSARLHVEHLMQLEKFRKAYNEDIYTIGCAEYAIGELKKAGNKPRYINNLIDTMRVYTRYSIARSIPHDERIFGLKYLKEEEVLKATMSDEEIEAFLTLRPPQKRGFNQTNYDRWTVFFSILAFTGMRPNEVAKLSIEDVDFGRSVFIISAERSKTHQVRFVPIAPNIIPKLQEYMKTCSTHLFPSHQGGNTNGYGMFVDSVDWGYNFKTRVKVLGIQRKGLSVYSLRHSFITRLLEEDVNIFKVKKIAGHSDIRTTEQYTHLTTKDIQRAILKHPMILKATGGLAYLEALKTILKELHVEQNPFVDFSFNETNNTLDFHVSLKPLT